MHCSGESFGNRTLLHHHTPSNPYHPTPATKYGPKSHGLCPTFKLNALVGTFMLLVNWQVEFGRDKR